MATKECVVCGAEFEAPPSSKKITCSPRCSSTRKRETHLGKRHPWSDDARARLAARGQTRNLAKGTPAAQQSPIAGPFETNREAKIWRLLSPTGERYEVRNLALFCREHPELFGDEPELAYAGLRQVQAWLQGKTRRRVSQWKGWTLERPAVYPDEE